MDSVVDRECSRLGDESSPVTDTTWDEVPPKGSPSSSGRRGGTISSKVDALRPNCSTSPMLKNDLRSIKDLSIFQNVWYKMLSTWNRQCEPEDTRWRIAISSVMRRKR